jgi:membrane protein implicated in regulation of membrane protease activity
MMDWLSQNAWAAWLAIAVALAAAELISLDLILLMLSVGALGGVVVAAIGLDWPYQVVASLVVSVAMLGLIRPNIVRRLHSGPELTTGHAGLVGKSAVVLEQVDARNGRVKLGGQLWSARSYDDSVIAPGATVDVFEIDGATAVVYQVQPPPDELA